MTDRHQQKPYPLRMPDELRIELEGAAQAGGRSLHSEILQRLHMSLEPGGGDHAAFLRQELTELAMNLEMERMKVESREAEMAALAGRTRRAFELLQTPIPAARAEEIAATKLHIETAYATYHVPMDQKVRQVVEMVTKATREFVEAMAEYSEALHPAPPEVRAPIETTKAPRKRKS